MTVLSHAVHVGFASSTSLLLADPSVDQVAVCYKGAPSGGGGALFLIESGAALNSVFCGVGLFLTASGTALTGGPSKFISVSHSKAALVSSFLEGQKGLRLHNSVHSAKGRKQPHNPHSQSEKGTVTTGTTGGEGGTHKERSKEFPTRSTSETGQVTSKSSLHDRSSQIPLISTLYFSPPPLFSHFYFPLLRFPYLSCPFLSSLRSTSSRSQLLRKFFSCMAWCSLSRSPSSLGNAPLSSDILFFWRCSIIFLHHETSHLKLFPKRFAFLPGDPSCCPQFSSFFCCQHHTGT